MKTEENEDKIERNDAGQTTNLAKNESKKRRGKHPEMARYQPPNSRSNPEQPLKTDLAQPTSSKQNDPKPVQTRPEKNKYKESLLPNQHSDKPTPQKDAKNVSNIPPKSTEIENRSSLHKQEVLSKDIPKTSCAGLLKINQNTLNELISKNEKLSINESNTDIQNRNDCPGSATQHLIVTSSHSNQFQASKPDLLSPNEHVNENLKFRTLFDPDNPDKPILVGLQSRSNPSQKINSNYNVKSRQNFDEKPSDIKVEKVPESKIDESILKVNTILKKFSISNTSSSS